MKQMQKLLQWSAVLALVACGDAKTPNVNDQLRPELAIPGVGAEGFSLSATETEVVYNGSFLFWQEGVTPAQIGRVSASTIESRKFKSALLRFIADDLTPKQAAVAKARAELAEATAAKEADRDR